MLERLTLHWWIPVVRGVCAIIFGLAAIAWPGETLFALMVIFGGFCFVDGAIALAAAIRFASAHERWVVLSIEGLLGVLVGVVALMSPGIVGFFFIKFVAVWAIFSGALELVAAFRVRRSLADELFLLSSGVLSVVLGLVVAFLPADIGLLAWIWAIGLYAILFGALTIAFGLRMRTYGSAPA
jgi:uncharacterized membrane protein HdeD (DUF308 family)